uniref:Uncharacterized protein n=1 Tax=Lepeophtheirus salmonis TaxID=72036 RepID=A0A0K2UFI6_LEPSM
MTEDFICSTWKPLLHRSWLSRGHLSSPSASFKSWIGRRAP